MKTIEELKERLFITCTEEEIMKYYNQMNYNEVRNWWKIFVKSDRLSNAPKTAHKTYFPWIDVIASMYKSYL